MSKQPELFKQLPPLVLDRNMLAFVGDEADTVMITAGHLTPRRARILIEYLQKILPDQKESEQG